MSDSQGGLVLDHVEGLRLHSDPRDLHDAQMALARLGEGLFWIHGQVAAIEARTRIEAVKENIQLAVSGGILEDKPTGLLACAFQWYALSACNYAQLVGWLVTRRPEEAKGYVRRVMPKLLNYRNKVAAHFAIADPRRDDTEVDLTASVMTQVIFTGGRLCAAALTPITTKDGVEITVSRDLSWSLTQTHDRLIQRYWPDGPPKSFQALRIPPKETVRLRIAWEDIVGVV